MGAPRKHTVDLGRRLTGIVAGAPALAAALVAVVGLAAGCSGGRGGASGYRLTSFSTRATLAPSLSSGWFQAADENTADIYLTDLPPQTLTSPEALAGATGNIVHIRMLLRPKAGRTPIEPTALTAAVVHIVLAGGEIGVYHGGGFMSPAGSTAARTFGGSIVGGTVHLGAATTGFVDRLGASDLTTGFRAEKDADRVREIRGALSWALSVTPAVQPESGGASPGRAEPDLGSGSVPAVGR